MTRPTATHDALGDARLQEYTAPQASLGEHGWRRPWTTRGVERAVEAARTAPLGSAPQARHGRSPATCRQGQGTHTVHPAPAPCALDMPRDRDRRCEPPLVTQRPRRRAGCAATGLAR